MCISSIFVGGFEVVGVCGCVPLQNSFFYETGRKDTPENFFFLCQPGCFEF